ncbi:MAG: glycosyltransferase family 2 protein [Bacillota bacterium]|nr:glycosyltransferase family 2 protein [Bacillota bacterium]
MAETLYLVMPAYNEAANLRDVVADWYPVLAAGDEASRMLILDDGSTDESAVVLEELAARYPQLHWWSRENRGHGATIRELYEEAVAAGADWILQTDSDGQTLSSEFASFWMRRSGMAMVIGDRHEREDGSWRRFVSWVLVQLIRLRLGVHLIDANTPYRLMRAEVLARLLPALPKDAHLVNALLAAAFVYDGQPCTWVPISFRARQGGVNSIDVPAILRHGRRFWGELGRARASFRSVLGPRWRGH